MSNNQTIHFIAGLPRSGSTLLCNVLAQNPRFHTTTTSGVLEVLTAIRNGWEQVEGFKASPCRAAKKNVLGACLRGFFEHVDEPVVFDKSRGWPSYIEMAERILGRKAKLLVPVRDLRDVVASFENIYRKHAAFDPLPQEKHSPVQWVTIEGRIQAWIAPGAPVGNAYNRIKDALARGFRDRMHFVEFERFTKNPARVLGEIYDFLGEPVFEHDFDHVEQLVVEDDTGFGFPPESLHKIRPKITPMPPRWEGVIDDASARQLAAHNKLWADSH